jgi:hypothetical protein
VCKEINLWFKIYTPRLKAIFRNDLCLRPGTGVCVGVDVTVRCWQVPLQGNKYGVRWKGIACKVWGCHIFAAEDSADVSKLPTKLFFKGQAV